MPIDLVVKTKPAVKAKPKAKVASSVDPTVNKAKALAEIICEQNPAILAAKEPKKLQDKARKELLDLIEGEYSPTEEIIVSTDKGRVKFGQMGTKRYVTDVAKVHKLLGDEAFYAIVTANLTDLDKYLTPAQLDQVIATGYGSRTMTILPAE